VIAFSELRLHLAPRIQSTSSHSGLVERLGRFACFDYKLQIQIARTKAEMSE